MRNSFATNFNPRSRTGSDTLYSAYLCPRGISIHAPAQGATQDFRRPSCSGEISIHAPAQGATRIFVRHALAPLISIHAPAQGATYCRFFRRIHRPFQSTLPHRERPPQGRSRTMIIYFNPRSRTGSDPIVYPVPHGRHISIHAPAQGATYTELAIRIVPCISIHAPAQGATVR